MLNKKVYIKKWLRSLLWITSIITVLIVLVAAMHINNNAICKGVQVNIKDVTNHLFITEKNILLQIDAANLINKIAVNKIDLKEIEKKLQQNIWIDKVDVYFNKQQILQIDITQRVPLYRLFTKNGNSFYVDAQNYILPLSDAYSAKLPLFTSFSNNKHWNSTDSTTLNCLQKIATFISNNEFWMAQIQQVDIGPNDMFELIPTFGNHIIIFGDTTDMEAKFKKLDKFYSKVSTVVGFDKYAVLNVQFKNQIIATYQYTENIDTAQAKDAIQRFLSNNADSSLTIIDTTKPKLNLDTIQNTQSRNNSHHLQQTITTPNRRIPLQPATQAHSSTQGNKHTLQPRATTLHTAPTNNNARQNNNRNNRTNTQQNNQLHH